MQVLLGLECNKCDYCEKTIFKPGQKNFEIKMKIVVFILFVIFSLILLQDLILFFSNFI